MAQEPDIDLGAVTEALNNKVDTDVGNTTATGNATIANLGFPSEYYEDVTLKASGSSYTAPADGWYTLTKQSSAASQYLNFIASDSNYSVIYSIYHTSAGSSQACSLLAPVAKGMVMRVDYNLGGSTMYFRFIYAKGCEPQS